MSGYYVKRPEADLGHGGEDFTWLAESYPAIAWFLAGRPKDHPEGAECPGSLIIFLDSGKLKFCLSPKIGRDVAFGSVTDPTKPMDSIEASLVNGSIEWKKRR
jgi:metal-dependent amidase/aminoacylase/carboxypeptidase family protein